ncbi:hypothetical protein FS842_005384 [Serendipita sp. 407]|nr:hypothetical protein FS842_005384 [Serendipita sp. 407]
MEGAEYVNVPKMKVIAVKSGALEDGEPVAGPSSQTGSISGKKRKASNTDLDRPRPLSEEKDRREDKKRKTTKVKKGSS